LLTGAFPHFEDLTAVTRALESFWAGRRLVAGLFLDKLVLKDMALGNV
jgi:hypothetical protein